MRNGCQVLSGFTLVETLVSVAILAIVVGIVLPGVQASREAARRVTCQNNLKQVGLALQEHASAQGTLPSLYNGSFLPQPPTALDEFHFHSWRTAILPSLEASPIYNSLNLALPATVAGNQTGVNVGLAVFVCPSTSNPTRIVPNIHPWQGVPPWTGTAARNDYEAVGGIRVGLPVKQGTDFSTLAFGVWDEPTYDKNPAFGPVRYHRTRLADITDGLAGTMLVAEWAGGPDRYRRGKLVEVFNLETWVAGLNHQAAWAISIHFPYLVLGDPASVNESNSGVYSFHPGGANVALGDGSVRFLKDSTDPAILKALVTRAGSETVTADY